MLFLDFEVYNVVKILNCLIIQKGGFLINLFVRGFFRGAALFSIFVLFSVWSLFIGPADSVRIFLYYGFIAFFLGCGSAIYHICRWSLVKRVFVHYIATLATVFPILLVLTYDASQFTTDIAGAFIIFNILQVLAPSITHSLSEILTISGSKYV